MPETLSQEPRSQTQPNRSDAKVYETQPLSDPRWDDLVERHPSASIFHSRAWLEALRRTYGYDPIAYTTSAPGEPLRDGLVLCRVESWLTGRRLVSVPFSDHCQPLLRRPEDIKVFFRRLQKESDSKKWRYVEIRPLEALGRLVPPYYATAKYTLHRLDLKPDLATLFRGFHRSSIQRKIKRAQREGLTCEAGSTESILDTFYKLLTVTRRRHGIPPQPKIWFRNLVECFGSAVQFCIAYQGSRPVAGMLTIRHKSTLVYKNGGSDARFNNLGSMHSLYWEAIQRAKSLGLDTFDLGRSDWDQAGLITFKGRWGSTRSNLTYFRITQSSNPNHWFEPTSPTWKTRATRRVFSQVPTFALPTLGNILYKHIG
jgi:hypothetical protein